MEQALHKSEMCMAVIQTMVHVGSDESGNLSSSEAAV